MKAPAPYKPLFPLSIWVAFLAIGISIISYSAPYAATQLDERSRQLNYISSLISELKYNSRQTDELLEHYKKNDKTTPPPFYLDDAYKAGMQSGSLYIFEGDTPEKLMNAYANLAQWNRKYGAAPNLEVTELVLDDQLKLSASIGEALEDVGIDATTYESAQLYIHIHKAGLFMVMVSLIGFILEAVYPSYRHKLVNKLTAKRKPRKRK
jgi:hypothetical protein